ncbi:MAG: EAL domain-containing protein [Acidimicrobiales bacterium]|nr:EAL domain-containing protein [Acidimicrobiales bacterium]
MRPEVGSEAWHQLIAGELQRSVVELADAPLDGFDEVLVDVFGRFGRLLGANTVGEATTTDEGVVWFDDTLTTLEEVEAFGVIARSLEEVTGLTTVKGPRGCPIVAAPANSGGFSKFTAFIGEPGCVPGVDILRALGMLSAIVGAARQRICAERELRDRAERQDRLNELSEMAATATPDPETLEAMLELARTSLDTTAASTLVRDGDEFVLVASTDVFGERPVPIGTRTSDTVARLLESANAGHLVRPLEDFVRSPDALVNSVGDVLVVPRYVGTEVAGVVVFMDARNRTWLEEDIEFAKSVSRSIQNLVLRTDMDARLRRRHELDRMISAVATIAARTTLEALDEVMEETLRLAIEGFGLTGASIWASVDDRAVRVASRAADGELSHDRVSAPFDEDGGRRLVESGVRFVEVSSFELDGPPLTPSGTGLVVPIGVAPSGFVVFIADDKTWTDDEIAAAKALASLAEQTRVRLRGDAAIHERLRGEALTAAVAAAAVDTTTANVDERVATILRLVQDHFGVVEASIWRFGPDTIWCDAAVRTDGRPAAAGWTMPLPPGDGIRSRGWGIMRLGSLDLGDNRQLDPDDTKLLVVGYGSAVDLIGGVVLTDHTGRWWHEEDIATVRSVGAIIGQLHLRIQYARRLERQQSIERVLADTSARFVHATLDDANQVVEDGLEELRRHFGLASLTLLHLDRPSLQMQVSCEVTEDGLAMLASLPPLDRDAPAMARILDPAASSRWPLSDLFPTAPAGIETIVLPTVRGRDVVMLVATVRAGSTFSEDAEPSLLSMVGSIAQLRRRLLLERHSRRRAEADQLVGSIARSFIEQPPHDHNSAVAEALERIGTFFGHVAISYWDVPADEPLRRVFGWSDPDHADLDASRIEVSGAGHPLSSLLATSAESEVVELGAHAPIPELSSHTMLIQRFGYDDFECGLAAQIARPKHQIDDLDIQLDVLENVTRLVEQLWQRADAELLVSRRLQHEDRLRRFATTLLSVDADSNETAEAAFAELVASVGVDQATICRFAAGPEGFDCDAVLHVAKDGVGALDERFQSFVLPLGFTDPATAPHFSASATQWPIDEAPAGTQQMLRATVPPGPRQIAFLPAPGSDHRGDGSYLTLSRPGNGPFAAEDLELFRSAHSILVQHEARVAAERYFGAAFNSAPVGISLRDRDLRLLHCNAAYCDLLGRSHDALVGTDLHEVMPRDMADQRVEQLADAHEGSSETESVYRRPDGTIRWASVRSTAITIPGRRGPLYLSYAEDITDRRRNREMLEYQATHDELTGLPNRRSLVAEIAQELAHQSDCAVLVLDLDRFKVVNDSLGHSVGDQLLITCSDRIRLSLRPGDGLCRLGGDEFAILLRAPADAHAAGVVADRLLTLLREPVIVGDDEVFPSASIGIAIPNEGDSVEDLLRHADAAMYQAKGLGRDRWEAFDGSMRQAVVDRIRTETDLRRAIENGQLEVHYQPEFLLETGEIVGTEALVRWRHPERGLLAAGSFISLAEETGLVVDLGRWVLTQATLQGAAWLAAGHDIITRVNLSARQLRGAVVAEVEEALRHAGLPANRLCLELTETAIMDDVQESARILARFRELGVQVAIDDFGTGFSSLAYLKRFPVDILKIDRTFVDGVGVDPDDTAIVRSVIGLARTLRLEVVAEGIEDASQVGELVRLGCVRGQGFHLARPAPAEDVSMLLAGTRAPIRE